MEHEPRFGQVGTRNAYAAGCRCDDCRKANTEWARNRRAQNKSVIVDTSWNDTEPETEYSEYSCPQCGNQMIWTTGHTLIQCLVCNTEAVSPSVINRITTIEKTRQAIAVVEKSPLERIQERALLDTNRKTVIRNCEETIMQLDTSQFKILWPALSNPFAFGNEVNAQQYRDFFESFISQAKAATTMEELGYIWEIVRNTRSAPQVSSILANIRLELNDLARRLSDLNRMRSPWHVTQDGKLVPTDWSVYSDWLIQQQNDLTRSSDNGVIPRQLLGIENREVRAIENRNVDNIVTLAPEDIYEDENENEDEDRDNENKWMPGIARYFTDKIFSDIKTMENDRIMEYSGFSREFATELADYVNAVAKDNPSSNLYARRINTKFFKTDHNEWKVEVGFYVDENTPNDE